MSSPAIGSPVRFERLPGDIRDLVAGHHEHGPDPARGVLWFANGDELSLTVFDELRRASPALLMFAAVGAGIVAYDAFSDGDATRWLWAAIAIVCVVAAIAAGVRGMSRNERAMRGRDLGTWLFPETLVLVCHGRYVVMPRVLIIRAGIDSTGKGGERERFVTVFYRAKSGVEKPLHLTGFLGNEAAIAALHRWVGEGERSVTPDALP